MGWASGSEILSNCWTVLRKEIPEKKRIKILSQLIEIFENADCDTADELIEEFPEAKKALELCGHDFSEED